MEYLVAALRPASIYGAVFCYILLCLLNLQNPQYVVSFPCLQNALAASEMTQVLTLPVLKAMLASHALNARMQQSSYNHLQNFDTGRALLVSNSEKPILRPPRFERPQRHDTLLKIVAACLNRCPNASIIRLTL